MPGSDTRWKNWRLIGFRPQANSPVRCRARATGWRSPDMARRPALLPDAKWLIYRTWPLGSHPNDIFAAPLTGIRRPVPLVTGPATERMPRCPLPAIGSSTNRTRAPARKPRDDGIAYGLSHIGKVRKENQDYFEVSPPTSTTNVFRRAARFAGREHRAAGGDPTPIGLGHGPPALQ